MFHYETFVYPPGLYDIVIRGSAPLAQDSGYKEITVTIELLDPCAVNPTTSEAVLEDQSYIVTQAGFTYTLATQFAANTKCLPM